MDNANINAENENVPINVVGTVSANCQDCYRCVRGCPVKAIRVHNGQALIEDKLCIRCGNCVRECPQHAKIIISSLDHVKELIATRKKVAVSVAPSFPAVFRGWRASRLPAALRCLGFSYISETAEGAKLTSDRSVAKLGHGSVCTACPAVVNYVEKYRPDYVDSLITVVSPMTAHGRILKKRLGEDTAVVFIGPCAAKKQEILRPENSDAVDAVLTFAELCEWLEEEKIDLATCSDSGFENIGDFSSARLFPIQGGMLKTCGIDCDGTEPNVIHISGAKNVIDLFDLPQNEWKFNIAEPLFCTGGCIGGPGFPDDGNIYTRKADVISYVDGAPALKTKTDYSGVDTDTNFIRQGEVDIETKRIDESTIQHVLEVTGKGSPELQLNCGSCGYNTCREKAIAVALGMAEPGMCLPHMRRLASQRTDRIIETSPSGVVILDGELNMISMNPAFAKMFMCTNSVIGRRISYLINADGFEKIASGTVEQFESIKTKYGVRYHELLYALRGDNQYVGIYTDISKMKFDASQLDLIKKQTIEHARELLDHQIKFSQEMAHYLGKSTAQSEELVKRMMDLYEENDM